MPGILTFITVSGPIDVYSVDRSAVQLMVMLPRASTFIVHLVWHMVRTSILPLSPGRPIFSLIRWNISSFWDELYKFDVFV